MNTNTGIGPGGAGWQTRNGEDDAAVWVFPRGEAMLEARVDPVAFGGPGDQRIRRVERVEGRLVAVGSADGDAGVWTSEDGQAWDGVEAAALGGDGDQEILDATSLDAPGFEAKLVAVGRDGAGGAVWLSEDGVSWTRVPDPDGVLAPSPEVTLNRVLYVGVRGGPALVAGGSAGGDAAVWTSNDGIEWVREPGEFGGEGQQTIRSLRTQELGVIAVGSSGPENRADAAVWIGTSPR